MPDYPISLNLKIIEMKRYFLLLFFFFSGTCLFAQSLDQIYLLMVKKDFIGAKDGIDKFLSQPKNQNKQDALYYKGLIYSNYSWDEKLSPEEAFKLNMEAYDSYKKFLSMKPKDSMLNSEFLNIYEGFFNSGIKQFNAKSYEASLVSFKSALEVKNLIIEKKYTYENKKFTPLDTLLVNYTGTAAVQAKKEEEAISYFRMITDANVSGGDYQSVYEYLADYYSKNDKEKEMNEILEKGRRLYPGNDFWAQIDLAYTEKKGDEKATMAKYEQLIAGNPGNFALLYDYSVLLYNTIYTGEKKHPDDALLKEKLTRNLQEAIKADTGIDATMLMATHLFSLASEYSSEASMIKGTKPEDAKKKKEMNALANKYMDEFLPYADKYLNFLDAKPSLKPGQKANYRNMASNVSEVYSVKGNTKKADEYEKKKAAKQ